MISSVILKLQHLVNLFTFVNLYDLYTGNYKMTILFTWMNQKYSLGHIIKDVNEEV